MVAKRLIPMLHLLEGRVVDPEAGTDLGSPATWAQRLEMEGADEILFRELGQGARWRREWLAETARRLFIPLLLEARMLDGAEAEEAVREGADLIIVPAADLGRMQDSTGRPTPDRCRFAISLEVAWSPSEGWNPALDVLAQAGAGELVLEAGEGPLAELCAWGAHLAEPMLLRCADPVLAAEALVHGADGILYPAVLRTPSAFKALLAGAGVSLRL